MASPSGVFESWPVQLVDEAAEIFLWYTQPCAFCVQYYGERVSLHTAQRVVGLIDRARSARRQEILDAGGFLAFHDIAARTFDPQARSFVVAAWGKLSAAEVKAVYVRQTLGPIGSLMLRAVSSVAASVTGKSMEIVSDLRPALVARGVVAPRSGQAFPVAR